MTIDAGMIALTRTATAEVAKAAERDNDVRFGIFVFGVCIACIILSLPIAWAWGKFVEKGRG